MKTLMITAMDSGSGKTSVTCALLSVLRECGLSVQALKCGPDYIDPMFHTHVLHTPSRNLDLFLQGEAGALRTLSRCRAEYGIIEGAMGYYDGLGGTAQASGWDVARLTGIPAILVLSPKGSALTLAAQVRGLMDFRRPGGIAGLLLNRCSPALCRYLTPILTGETGLPVLGCLPQVDAAALPSRHLGLWPAGEIGDLQEKINALARQLERFTDVDALLSLAAERHGPMLSAPPTPTPRCRIGVARDEAFCFYYADSLEALEEAGAELVFFSPLHDSRPPADLHGLYLGGGYPEVYAKALSENREMLAALRALIQDGLPTVAECGGLLYLQQSLEDVSGVACPMAGVLPGEGKRAGGLVRFGYLNLRAETDSLLFRQGECIPAHEFHHWDSTCNGEGLLAEKPLGAQRWRCGFVSPSLYAGFPHLMLTDTMAQRFAAAAIRWGERP